MNVAYNMDCMEAMREMPDNAFDLAVVDPPYGDALNTHTHKPLRCHGGDRWDKYSMDALRRAVRPVQVPGQSTICTAADAAKRERERETRSPEQAGRGLKSTEKKS